MPTSRNPPPLGVIPSLLAFGGPALFMYLMVWQVVPRLERTGTSPMLLFILMGLPLAAMLVATFFLYRAEGNAMTWPAFRERLRLGSVDRKTALWMVLLAIGGIGLYMGGVRIVDALFPTADVPASIGRLLGDRTTFLGHPLKGAWWLLGVWFVFYLFNVFGEELWFRGMVLPRQEEAFGRWAWAFHGCLWAGWHAGFFAADALVILPEALAYGWVSQRARSTWPALAAHALLNALASLRLIAGILG